MGKLKVSDSYILEIAEAGIDYDGPVDMITVKVFVRDEQDNVLFTIFAEGPKDSEAAVIRQAQADAKRLTVLWNAAVGVSNEKAEEWLKKAGELEVRAAIEKITTMEGK